MDKKFNWDFTPRNQGVKKSETEKELTHEELVELGKKLEKEADEDLMSRTKNAIGEERFNHVMGTVRGFSAGVQDLVLLSEEKEKGSGEKIEELLRDVSNNISLHASAVNGKPEKLIKALEEFVSKTNFS